MDGEKKLTWVNRNPNHVKFSGGKHLSSEKEDRNFKETKEVMKS
jgi:hypothetical protein